MDGVNRASVAQDEALDMCNGRADYGLPVGTRVRSIVSSDCCNLSLSPSSYVEYTTVSAKKRKKSSKLSSGVDRQNESMFKRVSALGQSVKFANTNPVMISTVIRVALGPDQYLNVGTAVFLSPPAQMYDAGTK